MLGIRQVEEVRTKRLLDLRLVFGYVYGKLDELPDRSTRSVPTRQRFVFERPTSAAKTLFLEMQPYDCQKSPNAITSKTMKPMLPRSIATKSV